MNYSWRASNIRLTAPCPCCVHGERYTQTRKHRCSMYKVNWEPLLTRDIVEDFAAHIRLYRKARARVDEQEAKAGTYACAHIHSCLILYHVNAVASEADGDVKLTDDQLESHFFDMEFEMTEQSYCRDLVSTSRDHENGRECARVRVCTRMQHICTTSPRCCCICSSRPTTFAVVRCVSLCE
jgi:hypothetical protein